MSMTFKPKSEKEIQEQMLWPKGEYDFEVLEAKPAVSGEKSKTPGTPYIKLKLRVFNGDGGYRFVDSLLHPAMEAQLRHFCVEGGIEAKYEAGTLSHQDCVGISGKLQLKVKEAEGNYPAKNEVADFGAKKKKEEAKPVAATTQEEADSDIPF